MAKSRLVPMQNLFQPHRTAVFAAILLFFFQNPAVMADSYANARPGDKSSDMRLIGAKNRGSDGYRAGVEITLKQGALTYWRQPGDAGVPPVFSFEGSDNLKKADVLYPAPDRIREDEGEAFGYRGKVVFPVHVTPRDTTKPTVLNVTVDYAVCERICIPAKSQATINLPASPSDAQDSALLQAEALIPQRLTPQEASSKLTIAPEKNPKYPAWRLSWTGAAPATDLFAEAPEGWYFETKKMQAPNEFTIVAAESPANGAIMPVPVTLTVTGEKQNFEVTLPFDIGAGAR